MIILTNKNWLVAINNLKKKDKILKEIINRYKSEKLISKKDAFITLAKSITGQQISVKAANSIWQKLEKKLKKVNSDNILKLKKNEIAKCGFSKQKVSYLLNLSNFFKKNKNIEKKWNKIEDEKVIEDLVKIKGIGRWTAEMFLIFYLLRPNIFPSADIGLLRAISINYKLKYPLKKTEIEKFKKKWQPWSTVATWYLWRSLDPIPVKY
ncbi:MAG: DNA-3-methyladenine glycosylase [Alphaproteobacteria bacterium MarineAlpha6_Bin3]|nr:MAG: DNA-3-methyladenine glycosylase [Alphaproteobacteria bacterium MarineAlpha6_Bin3]|tara:strand:- start:5661 stop:6287 length:627 start_codon:yes stop_codon:yes gene_type:complete